VRLPKSGDGFGRGRGEEGERCTLEVSASVGHVAGSGEIR